MKLIDVEVTFLLHTFIIRTDWKTVGNPALDASKQVTEPKKI